MTEKRVPHTNEPQWDTEDHDALLSGAVGHLRETTMYLTTPLWKQMKATWGGVITHVKTATDEETGEVSVFKAKAKEKGACKVRLITGSTGVEFSWFRPLRKLGLKVPLSRQFNVTPRPKELDGFGTVYIFPMAERVSVPRSKKDAPTTPNAPNQVAASSIPAKTEPNE